MHNKIQPKDKNTTTKAFFSFSIYILFIPLYLSFPISFFTDQFTECNAASAYSGEFTTIHKPERGKYRDSREYITFKTDNNLSFEVMLWPHSPLYNFNGKAKAWLTRYQTNTMEHYYYPVKIEANNSMPILTCNDYKAFLNTRKNDLENQASVTALIIILMFYCFYRYKNPEAGVFEKIEVANIDRLKCLFGLLLFSVILHYKFPSTLIDTFPICNDSIPYEGTFTAKARKTEDDPFEFISRNGEHLSIYKPDGISITPGIEEYRIQVTPYHYRSIFTKDYYPVSIQNSQHSLIQCKDYYHFALSRLEILQMDLYIMAAALLGFIFCGYRLFRKQTLRESPQI